jgi:hypothetical protein
MRVIGLHMSFRLNMSCIIQVGAAWAVRFQSLFVRKNLELFQKRRDSSKLESNGNGAGAVIIHYGRLSLRRAEAYVYVNVEVL